MGEYPIPNNQYPKNYKVQMPNSDICHWDLELYWIFELARRFGGLARRFGGLGYSQSSALGKGRNCSLWERPASYQVVGGVTAYQAYDG